MIVLDFMGRLLLKKDLISVYAKQLLSALGGVLLYNLEKHSIELRMTYPTMEQQTVNKNSIFRGIKLSTSQLKGEK